jgi:SAM-dependent methyltransferase
VSEQLTARANNDKLSLLSRFLDKSDVFVEFAPGDCRFAAEVVKHVKYGCGVDISDQRNPADKFPENFKLIVYDGYNLDEIESNSIDIVFSDQLIEHIHPDDTKLHFILIHRILKNGGKYVFRTPHSLTGPHDVSGYFSDEPECFHLKEWTYIELKSMLTDLKYSKFCARWHAKGIDLRMPYTYFVMCEQILGLFPKRYTKVAAKYLIPSLYGVAIK